MSVSMEALAMAGADYLEYGKDIEEWEHEDLEPTPPHLLADDDDDEEEDVRAKFQYGFPSLHFSQDLLKPSRHSSSSGGYDNGDEDQITIPYQPKLDFGICSNKDKSLAWRVRSIRLTLAMMRAVLRLLMSFSIDIGKKIKTPSPTSLV